MFSPPNIKLRVTPLENMLKECSRKGAKILITLLTTKKAFLESVFLKKNEISEKWREKKNETFEHPNV